jgi:plastocyanin
MRKNRLLGLMGTVIAVTALAVFVAACDDNGGGGDATATQPAATEPAATEPAATSTQGGETPTSEGTAATGAELEIEAQDVAFSTDALQAPAGEAFTVLLKNKDDGTQHTFSLYASQDAANAGQDPLATTGRVTGPAEKSVSVSALQAGDYYFQCDVHPSMNGTLTAQ